MSTSANPIAPLPTSPTPTKPRVPKSYTPDQLAFLHSHLAEFERRSSGSVRGDAKKFALEKAAEFICRFGLPPAADFDLGRVGAVDEREARFREVSFFFEFSFLGEDLGLIRRGLLV
jgi:hypothetical protein